jgi:hypothetical protein
VLYLLVDCDEYLDLVRVSEPSGVRPRDFYCIEETNITDLAEVMKEEWKGGECYGLCQFVQVHSLKLILSAFLFFSRHTPSQADVAVFDVCKTPSDTAKYPHVARWYVHIASYEKEHPSLSGDKSKAAELLA